MSSYYTKMMLNVLVYAYTQRIYSSRQIAKALRENVNFTWIIVNNRPDFRTINRFRSTVMRGIMEEVFTAVVLCPLPTAFPTDRLPICWAPSSRNRSIIAASIALARTFGWRATYQLDWWHITHAFHRTFPDHPKLVHRLTCAGAGKQALYRGQGHRIPHIVRLAQLNGVGNPERVASLLTYVEANQRGFYGARSLRPQLSDQARLVCVEGSGAVEKHIDLVICRRFPGLPKGPGKGQGMHWTRRGANHLSKIPWTARAG